GLQISEQLLWHRVIPSRGFEDLRCCNRKRRCFEVNTTKNKVTETGILIQGFAQTGYVEEALKLFEEISEWNVESSAVMIAGRILNEFFGKSLKLFREIQLTGM
ncbi:hypothetical protein KI387_010728, partial [Taxus chinensis]